MLVKGNQPRLEEEIALVFAEPPEEDRQVIAETVYGVTSLDPARADADRLLRIARQHWRIENHSHWVRDVTFDEDRSQVRCGSTPEVIAAIRNAAIGLLRISGETNIAAACRRLAARPRSALALVGIVPDN
jgi:Transposase DDE domain